MSNELKRQQEQVGPHSSSESLRHTEETLVIVKPDGIKKGLVGKLVSRVQGNGLKIDFAAMTKLDKEWVKKLYKPEKDKVYYQEVVNWVSSSSVLLLKISGEQAIDKIKWDVVGRYPNGIRGEHSENWIQNVAHAPDSAITARRELGLAQPIFDRLKKEDEERFKGKKVFALTGMSESGKSTVGRYLDSRGVARLKIGEIFDKVKDKLNPISDLYEFVEQEEVRNPYALWDAFIDELLKEMNTLGVDIASIESLYGGDFGPYLKMRMGVNFSIVYIEIPLDIRLQRQMIRENLSTIEEAKAELLPRDKIKAKSGIPELLEITDELINNSGGLEDLYNKAESMLQKHATLAGVHLRVYNDL